MTVTHMSHRDAPVTPLTRHAVSHVPQRSVPPTRPDPTHNYYGPQAASMTSGRGWPSTGRDHHQAVSASVMDAGYAGSDGGVR